MGRSKDFGKSSTNPQAEKLEKNKDQGVDAYEQREETKEESEDALKGGNGQEENKEGRRSS